MAFSAQGFLLATLLTSGMADRARAAQLSMLGGALGNNATGVVLLAAAANEGRFGTTTAAGSTGAAALPAPAAVPALSRVQVPELPNDPEKAADVLRAHGLVPATAEVASEEPMETVIESDPEARTIVRLGSTVTILVSAGLAVPNVVGRHVDDAVEVLNDAGFGSVTIETSERTGREDVVEKQEPAAGERVDSTTEVVLHRFLPPRGLESVSGGSKGTS